MKEKHSISRTEGKKWIIFAVKVNDVLHTEEEFIKQYVNHNLNIYNIYKWGSYDITIDYSGYKWGDWNDLTLKAPAEVMELVDNLTLKCPVSTSFGVNEGIGEGLVLVSETISPRTNKPYYLKVKNSKYEAEVLMPNVKDFSVHPNLTSFLLIAVTESRLEQFFDKMENDKVEINMKNVKLFQNLVLADIEKECIDDLGCRSGRPGVGCAVHGRVRRNTSGSGLTEMMPPLTVTRTCWCWASPRYGPRGPSG